MKNFPFALKGGKNQQIIDNDNVLSISHFTSTTRFHWNAYAPARVPLCSSNSQFSHLVSFFLFFSCF